MKKLLPHFLLMTLLVIFVSACSSDELVIQEEDKSTYDTYIVVRADAGNGQVTLEWTMEYSAATYNIYYMEDDGSDTQPDYDDLKANGTKIVGADLTPDMISAPYTITGLENGKTYWFSITGVNSSGVEGDLSTPTSAKPTSPAPLPAPENVRANAGNAKVTVTWTPVTGADYYVLYCYWQEETNADIGSITVSGGATSSQVVDSSSIVWNVDPDGGIINDRTYYFYLFAVDNNDTPSDTSDDIASSSSFSVWATPSATPPPFAPANLIAITGVTDVADSGEVYLDWSAVADATSYNVYIGSSKNMTILNYSSRITGGTVTGYLATGLTDGTKYYFAVTAVNDNGESALSNEVSATPAAP